MVYYMLLFSFYRQDNDVGETHSLVQSTVYSVLSKYILCDFVYLTDLTVQLLHKEIHYCRKKLITAKLSHNYHNSNRHYFAWISLNIHHNINVSNESCVLKNIYILCYISYQYFGKVINSFASRHTGYHSCFVFGRSRIQISGCRPAILTEFFRGFPKSLHANAMIVP
jgi:hypothetical protein